MGPPPGRMVSWGPANLSHRLNGVFVRALGMGSFRDQFFSYWVSSPVTGCSLICSIFINTLFCYQINLVSVNDIPFCGLIVVIC